MQKSLTDMPHAGFAWTVEWSSGRTHLCLCECMKESSIYSTDSHSSTVTVQSVDQMRHMTGHTDGYWTTGQPLSIELCCYSVNVAYCLSLLILS